MTVKNRAIELERKANVNKIESACLLLEVGERKSFRVIDLQAQQRIKMRLSRLKNTKGVMMSFDTELEGNNIIVTRKEYDHDTTNR